MGGFRRKKVLYWNSPDRAKPSKQHALSYLPESSLYIKAGEGKGLQSFTRLMSVWERKGMWLEPEGRTQPSASEEGDTVAGPFRSLRGNQTSWWGFRVAKHETSKNRNKPQIQVMVGLGNAIDSQGPHVSLFGITKCTHTGRERVFSLDIFDIFVFSWRNNREFM